MNDLKTVDRPAPPLQAATQPATITRTDAGWKQARVFGVVVASRYGESGGDDDQPDVERIVREINASALLPQAQALAAEFERGRQQGMEQERALWELAKDGQEIEAGPQAQGTADPLCVDEMAMDNGANMHTGGGMSFKAQAWYAFRDAVAARLAQGTALSTQTPEREPIAWGCFYADGRLCFDLVGTKEDCEYWRDADDAFETWTVRPIYG